MTNLNNAAQAANPDFVATELRGIIDVCGDSPTAIVSVERMRVWLSKLRAPVADERGNPEQPSADERAANTPIKAAYVEHFGHAAGWLGYKGSWFTEGFHAGRRAALASAPVAKPAPEHFKPPFDNCSFRMCDLPGQCRGEGKCHHPAGAPVAGEALFWYRPRSDGWYEGPIHNDRIEEARKRSGAWVPLVAASQASALNAEYARGRADGFDAGHSAALGKAAAALEDHRRAGREWVPGSLWDTLSREAAARIRALKQPQAAQGQQ